MKTGRHGLLGFECVVFILLALPALASAAYPERPIRLIISSAAGGSPDVVTRILAAELVKQLGQQIVIDNRPGAAQTIGTEMVVRAIPDGYTLGYANVVTLQSPSLKERYAAIDAEPVGGTIEAFAAFVKSESVKWADVVRKSGARLD